MENIIVAFIVCFAAYFAGRKLLGPTVKKTSGCGCTMADHCATATCNEAGDEGTRSRTRDERRQGRNRPQND